MTGGVAAPLVGRNLVGDMCHCSNSTTLHLLLAPWPYHPVAFLSSAKVTTARYTLGAVAAAAAAAIVIVVVYAQYPEYSRPWK